MLLYVCILLHQCLCILLPRPILKKSISLFSLRVYCMGSMLSSEDSDILIS